LLDRNKQKVCESGPSLRHCTIKPLRDTGACARLLARGDRQET